MKKLLFALLIGGGAYWYYKSRKPTAQNPALPKTNIISDALLDTNLMIKSLSNIGIRNNNPLNIRPTANSRKDPWVGQDGEAGGYLKFISPIYGFRAAARNLNSYLAQGVNTIAAITAKWAPKEDGNDPAKYAAFVSKQTGIPTYQPIGTKDFAVILKAMAKMETGKDYDIATILTALTLINVQTPKGRS